MKPVDNGNSSGKHLARNFPSTPRPLRGLDGHPVTQLEWARKGVITKEMIYVAERKNLGRKTLLDVAQAAHDDGESFGALVPLSSRRTSCATRWRAAAPSFRQHQSRRARPMAIGRDLLTKINANIGTPPSPLRWKRKWKDGVGDPLGRRHGDGPFHRPQPPQHPRMDSSQRAVPIGTVPIYQALEANGDPLARLGMLQGADRAVRAGRRFFHDSRRRAARLFPLPRTA